MIVQGIIVPIFSFPTPTYSDKGFWTEIFGCKFRIFGPLWGVEKANFGKLLNTPWDDHTRNVCINFQLSNPYLFRKTAQEGNFWIPISGFWTPRGPKKGILENRYTRREMIIQDTFVPIFSFLTPPYSEKQLWTESFGCKFQVFGPLGGQKS